MRHIDDLPSGLSRAEERELAAALRRGGPEAVAARDRLVLANLRFVLLMAGRAHRRRPWLPLEDVQQEFFVAACEAAATFDPDKGCFCTHAGWRIRHQLGRLVAKDRLIPLPYYIVSQGGRKQAAASADCRAAADAAMTSTFRDLPTLREIPMRPGDDDEAIDLDDRRGRAAAALARLDDRDRAILARRAAGETLAAIGDALGISKERVRQLERSAIRRARRLATGLTALADDDTRPLDCARCKAVRPARDFYRHASSRRGRTSWCKDCSRDHSRERHRRLRREAAAGPDP